MTNGSQSMRSISSRMVRACLYNTASLNLLRWLLDTNYTLRPLETPIMYGVVLNSGLGDVYATFGTYAECVSFLRRGLTRGLGKTSIVRNPYGDSHDPIGNPAPSRRILTGPNAEKDS